MQTISAEKAARIQLRLDNGLPTNDKATGQLERYRAAHPTATTNHSTIMVKRERQRHRPQRSDTGRAISQLVDHKAATYEYIHTLLDPEAETEVGVPILPGGFTPDSTTVKLRTEGTFPPTSAGEAYIAVYGAYQADLNPEPSVLTDFAAKVPGSSGGTAINIGYHSAPTSPATTANNQFSVPLDPLYASFSLPPTGLDLIDAEARLVSAELRVYQVSPVLSASGTGGMFTPGVWSEPGSTGAKDFSGLYREKRNGRVTMSLPNWEPGEAFAARYIPQRQSQLQYTDCPITASNAQGLPWAVFFAEGCNANMIFRYEIVWNFEINSNTLVTSIRKPISLDPPAILGMLPPTASQEVHSADPKPHVVSNYVSFLDRLRGNKAIQTIKSIGRGVSSVGRAIAPALLKQIGRAHV